MRAAPNPLILADYKPYAKLVATAYEARPVQEAAAMRSYAALLKHTIKLWHKLQRKLTFEFVAAPEPYADAAEMTREVRRTGVMVVSTLFSDNLASGWSPEENWIFRAVHDYVVHMGGKHPFTLRGELGAYNRHAILAPPAALPALFAEVPGQTCYFIEHGRFPNPQKACILHGFDYRQVGKVDLVAYEKNFR